MNARLHMAPSPAAALHHAVSRVHGLQRMHALAPVWILLPDVETIAAVRRRLGPAMAVHMFQFYRLAEEVLDADGASILRISPMAARRLVRATIDQLAADGELPTFRRVVHTRGFADAVVGWLREVKARGVTPEAIEAEAARSGNPRDRQLAAIFTRYQSFLHAREASDADGLLWLAAEALEKHPTAAAGVAGVLVAGFDQFTPVQLRLLAALAAGVPALDAYVVWDERQSPDGLALGRPAGLRTAFADTLGPAMDLLPREVERPQPLDEIVRHLFANGSADPTEPATPAGSTDAEPADSTGAEPASSTDAEPAVGSLAHAPPGEPQANRPSATEPVAAIEATSREAEVRETLRRAKALILEGVPAREILIVAPRAGTYTGIVAAVAAEYGIPVDLEAPLAAAPPIATLRAALEIAPNFGRGDVFDLLRSPYVVQPWLSKEDLNRLDILTRERPVVAGQDEWWSALAPVRRDLEEPDDDDLAGPPLASTLEPETLAALRQSLAAFFAAVTPPGSATYRAHMAWMQSRLLGLEVEPVGDTVAETDEAGGEVRGDPAPHGTSGDPAPGTAGDPAPHGAAGDSTPREAATDPVGQGATAPPSGSLGIVDGCRQGPTAERDTAAMAALLGVMTRLVEAADFVPPAHPEVPWSTFAAELLAAMATASAAGSSEATGVRFGDIEAARAVGARHVFILGLSEGELPRRAPSDPLFAPAERREGRLGTHAPDPAEDASIFWQVVAGTRAGLTLLRPRYDDTGSSWPASPFWEETLHCAPVPIERPHVGALPAAAACASREELLASLAAEGTTAPPELAEAWAQAERVARVAGIRSDWSPPGAYEGVLQSREVLQELVNERFPPGRGWSVSRLNRYGRCPYGFFIEHVLSVEPLEEPAAGLSPRQWGSLVHAVLERLYRGLATDGLASRDLDEPDLTARLDDASRAVFSDAPLRYGFRPGPLWGHEQEELWRSVAALVRWEARKSIFRGFVPYLEEQRFGLPGGLEALHLDDDAGVPFLVHGIIDRIDRDDGDRLLILDYKTGATKYSKADIERGLALQSTLYAVAASAALPGSAVVKSFYLHVPLQDVSGEVKFEGDVLEHPMVVAAVARAGRVVGSCRAGVFPAAPGRPAGGGTRCAAECPFQRACRVTRRGIWKARQAELT